MANNAFNFKGLYDKIVALVKFSDIDEDYEPNGSDCVLVYMNPSDSPLVDGNVIVTKKYVPVTNIGSGGGGGTGTMSSFEVSGAGGVTISLNGGAYTEDPITVENLDQLSISATSVPSGLNWEGPYNSGTTYQLNDVVSNVAGGLYSTWLYVNATPASGQALPVAPNTYNTYWAQLGTQGQPGATGATGAQGQPAATSTFGFVSVSQSGGSRNIAYSGNVGDSGNEIGKILLVNNTSTTNELVINIPINVTGNTTAAGWPYNSQITVINVTPETNSQGVAYAPVKVSQASGVTLNSADNAQYLRTTNSTCSIVRQTTNTYWMFGDLTNII